MRQDHLLILQPHAIRARVWQQLHYLTTGLWPLAPGRHGLVNTHGPSRSPPPYARSGPNIFPSFGHRGPFIRLHPAAGLSGIHHRLDRQHHALFQPRILVRAGPRNWGSAAPHASGFRCRAPRLPHDRKSVGGHMPLTVPQMSKSRLPGRAFSIAISSDSRVTSISRRAPSNLAHATVMAESP